MRTQGRVSCWWDVHLYRIILQVALCTIHYSSRWMKVPSVPNTPIGSRQIVVVPNSNLQVLKCGALSLEKSYVLDWLFLIYMPYIYYWYQTHMIFQKGTLENFNIRPIFMRLVLRTILGGFGMAKNITYKSLEWTLMMERIISTYANIP